MLLALAHALVLPAWMGEDEPWHVEYATLIARGHLPTAVAPITAPELAEARAKGELAIKMMHRRFGDVPLEEHRELQAELLDGLRASAFSSRVDWSDDLGGARTFDAVAPGFSAAHQPPAYYLVVGTTARVLGVTSATGVLRIGRSFALVAYLLVIALGISSARALGLSAPAVLVVGALLVLWPMHARHAAVVNNDVAAKLLASVAFWFGARGLGGLTSPTRSLLGASLFTLLAAGAKPTGLPATSAVVLVLLLLWSSPRRDAASPARWPLALGLTLVALGVVLVLTAHHAPVVPGSLTGLTDRLARAGEPRFWRALASTFVGSFNWESRSLPQAVVLTALGTWLLAALAGLGGLARTPTRGLRLFVCLPLAAQLGAVVLRGAAAGRYLFPAMLAFAILAGAAVDAAECPATRRRIASALVIGLVALSSYAFWAGLLGNQYARLGA
ncbi:MAG: hypothetical protein P1V81_05600 [Planctomycetota bacterium]|nr:hypothetical protein [Planctomycetota bacterium]